MEKQPTNPGRVIWITGLSGAGKTTLAKTLLPHLPSPAVLLDGDELRSALGMAGTGFDRDSRLNLALSYARLARLLAVQGLTVVVATISLFHSVHDWNRANQPNYLEVWLDVPEAECRRRDPKGLYAAQQADSQPMACEETAEFPRCADVVFRYERGRDLAVMINCIQKKLA
ncbi:adenylyl-sulfate kinase [Desulfonatronum parangueonense]